MVKETETSKVYLIRTKSNKGSNFNTSSLPFYSDFVEAIKSEVDDLSRRNELSFISRIVISEYDV